MISNLLNVLKNNPKLYAWNVKVVSKDFALYGSGACGKGYKEWVKTSVGGPYLKVRVKLG